MFVDHRAIVESATDPVVPAGLPNGKVQPSFVANFKPWQIAVIAVLGVAAWGVTIGVLLSFFGA